MITILNANFYDREITVNGNYYKVSGEVSVNFDREDFTFNLDYCKLKGISEKDKVDAENLIKHQFEAFILSDAVAAKEGKLIKFDYVNKKDLHVEEDK